MWRLGHWALRGSHHATASLTRPGPLGITGLGTPSCCRRRGSPPLAMTISSSSGSPDGQPPPGSLAPIKHGQQWASWGAAKALGFALCLPMGIQLVAKALLNPARALRGTQWSPEAQLPDPLPDLVHETIQIGRTRLHLVRTCTNPGGAKPVLLLLHGFPEGWFSWRHQMAALRDQYCLAALEMRGYGDSDKPQGVASYRMEELVNDVAGVIQAIAPPGSGGRVALAGHDWGGLVAWSLAHARPELVERLAILCAPHPACFLSNIDWDQAQRSWYILAFQTPWLPEAVLRWDGCALVGSMLSEGALACRNPAALTKEDLARYRQGFARPGVATAAINYYRAALNSLTEAGSRATDRLASRKLAMPVLVLWADQDAALGPQLLRGMERYAERLRVHIVADSSHWVQQDRWEEVNKLLEEFLSEPLGDT